MTPRLCDELFRWGMGCFRIFPIFPENFPTALVSNPMTQQAILAKLRTVIEPYVEDKQLLAQVSEDTDLLRDLKINSAHLVDIVLDTEDAFDIEIDDEAAEQMLTVGAALKIVQDRVEP
jgi:acyl carrier protein